MEKKDFVKAMKKIIESEDAFCNLEDAIQKVSDGCHRPIISKHIEICMDVIKLAMKDDNDWISYWFYDLEKGTRKKMKVKDCDGKVVKMKTLSDLYNCINNKKAN